MRLVGLLFLICILGSCSNTLTITEYREYEKSHTELYVSQQGYDPKLTLSFLPIEKVVVDNESEMTPEDLRAEYELMKKQDIACFEFSVERSGAFINEKFGSKKEQMEFYSTKFKSSIKAITTENDTVSCENFIFQAGAGFGNKGYFQFQFSRNIKQINKIYMQSQFFGDSLIEFDLKQFQHDYPSLKIK